MNEAWSRLDARNLGRIADALEQLVRIARRKESAAHVTSECEDPDHQQDPVDDRS